MREPGALRRRAGIDGDPDRDQYFLEDGRVIGRIIEVAPTPLGHVLEIGPGIGALTARLVDEAARVTAIERDESLVAFLNSEFAAEITAGQLEVVASDALEADLPAFDTCVSNLPYGIASPILFRLLPLRRPLVVMVQREFGERMAASPGTDEYGRLSVTAQHFGEVTVCEIVPPSVFRPQPAVESAVVRVIPREPTYTVPNEAQFLDIVRAVFTQRRKTLRNAIRNTTHISGIEDPDAILDELSEETLSRRPGTLEPALFARIATIATDVSEDDG